MLDRINPIVKGIEIPGIRKFSNQVSEMPNGINLTIGEPDFPTPELVKTAGIDAINQNLTGYSHNAGLIELRKEVANFFQDKYDFYYQPESEIMITNGASEALDSVLRTILLKGDEVILPAPIYSAYESLIRLNGGEAIYLDTVDTDFKPDANRLKSLITEKTKAIILNYPSNPTGVTLDEKEATALVEVLKKEDIFIISDEIYSENTFDHTHISFASYKELRASLFLVHGLSKSHAMTGWRVGFLLGPEMLMNQVLKVHLHNAICASLPSQYAAIEALANNRSVPDNMNESYVKRRDYVLQRLQDMGFNVISPNGAFYIFPSIQPFNMSSFDFATKLLQTEQVAVVPGSSFSKYGEGYIRISYANSMEQLVEALNRLQAFIASL